MNSIWIDPIGSLVSSLDTRHMVNALQNLCAPLCVGDGRTHGQSGFVMIRFVHDIYANCQFSNPKPRHLLLANDLALCNEYMADICKIQLESAHCYR